MLSIDPEVDSKKDVWAKREADELKKLEKLIKKEKNDFEDISGTGATNCKVVHDKIMKTLSTIRKLNTQYFTIKKESDKYGIVVAEQVSLVDSNLKKKAMLASMCDSFMTKMSDLYLSHEIMLDDENKKR